MPGECYGGFNARLLTSVLWPIVAVILAVVALEALELVRYMRQHDEIVAEDSVMSRFHQPAVTVLRQSSSLPVHRRNGAIK